MSISPVLGIIAGVVFTLIVIVLMILIRMRRSQESSDDDQKSVHEQPGGITKTLHRNVSPREFDERDPDIIPAKYGVFILTYATRKTRVTLLLLK